MKLTVKTLLNRIKQLKSLQQNAICIAAERLFKLNQAQKYLESLDLHKKIGRRFIDKKFKTNLYLK